MRTYLRFRGLFHVLFACGLAAFVLISAAPAVAQMDDQVEGQEEMSAEEAAMMEAWQASMTPGPEHAHLAEMVGDYDMVVTMWEDPDGEPEIFTGTASRSMILDGRVLHEDVESEVMGQKFHGEARVGYDNVTDEYWSTWVDNMSTGLYWARGEQKEDGTVVMMGKAPDPMAGALVEQKSVISVDDDGIERQVTYEKRDGEWVKMLEIVYTPK